MRRLWAFVFLATVLLALAAIDRVDVPCGVDEATHWRSAQATTATIAGSPWRADTLHVHLATVPVFIELSAGAPLALLVSDPGRSHAPPHLLNDSLLI